MKGLGKIREAMVKVTEDLKNELKIIEAEEVTLVCMIKQSIGRAA